MSSTEIIRTFGCGFAAAKGRIKKAEWKSRVAMRSGFKDVADIFVCGRANYPQSAAF